MVCLSKAIGRYGAPLSLLLIRPDLDMLRSGERNGFSPLLAITKGVIEIHLIPLSGMQVKHLIRTSFMGRRQWMRVTRANDASFTDNLSATLNSFEALRTRYVHSGHEWRQEILSVDEMLSHLSASKPSNQIPRYALHVDSQPDVHTLSIHHSVVDALSLESIATALAGTHYSENVIQPQDLLALEATPKATSALQFWNDYHSTRRGSLHDSRAKPSQSVETYNCTIQISEPYLENLRVMASRLRVTIPSLFISHVVNSVASALEMTEITLLTIFSNRHLTGRRTPGACLAQDVFVTTTAPLKEDGVAQLNADLLRAYAHAMFKWDALTETNNYTDGNFFRDVSVSVGDSFVPAQTGSVGDILVHSLYETESVLPGAGTRQSLVDVFAGRNEEGVSISCRSWLDRTLPRRVLRQLVAYSKPSMAD